MEEKNKNKEKENKKGKVKNVRALGKDLPISKKHAVAICNAIRGKKVKKAQEFLGKVMKKKKPVAMKGEIPHRAGLRGSGRYPIKAAEFFARLLNDLNANASVKNLDVENLIITKAIANQASRPYKSSRIAYGRKRLKRTHVELEAEAEEVKIKEKKKIKASTEEKAKEIKEEKKETAMEEKK